MPAKDLYHDAVVNALRKDGWRILKEQFRLVIENRKAWLDIRASKQQPREVIFIEVKSFENIPSQVAYLQQILGQYLLYRAIIEEREQNEDLFLAIPGHAYEGIFSEEIGKFVIRRFQLKIVVFDAEKETIIQWIT